MVFYVYGMVGWILFSDVDPAHWRTIGRALLTMFQLVTVEGWYEVQDAALASEPWAWVYFVSFIIISAFVLFNMVIGVVINSMRRPAPRTIPRPRRPAAPNSWRRVTRRRSL
jgi:voltage-gated sodium channel